jgi:hypothetical protein
MSAYNAEQRIRELEDILRQIREASDPDSFYASDEMYHGLGTIQSLAAEALRTGGDDD